MRILFLLILSLSTSALAEVSPCVVNLAELRYSPQDFPPALLWLGNTSKHDSFANWAAGQANQIAEASASSGLAILELAKERARFALHADHDRSELFGKLRINEGGHKKSQITTVEYLSGRDVSPMKEVGLIMLSKLQVPGRKGLLNIGPTNTYVSYLGARFQGSTIFREGGNILIRHPTGVEAGAIFKDVLARIEMIKKNSDLPLEDRRLEFMKAMYGYYNAMPFHRGSAAIGKIFFAGLYVKLFGSKLPELPDLMDVRAMVLTESEFVSFLKSNF